MPTNRIQVSLNDEYLKILDTLADDMSLSRSEYVRTMTAEKWSAYVKRINVTK